MSRTGFVGLETCISNYILRKKSEHREGQTGVQACVYTHTHKIESKDKATPFLFSQIIIVMYILVMR